MPSFYDIVPGDLIPAVAEKLKELPEIKPPDQLMFWKTGEDQEFPPVDYQNFWYIRCASLLRKLAKSGPVGINRMRKRYSKRKRRGAKPDHSSKAGGAIIRRCLQQLEECSLVKTTEMQGREISSQGRSLLDRVAHQIIRQKGTN